MSLFAIVSDAIVATVAAKGGDGIAAAAEGDAATGIMADATGPSTVVVATAMFSSVALDVAADCIAATITIACRSFPISPASSAAPS
jgi:hypothetical protein